MCVYRIEDVARSQRQTMLWRRRAWRSLGLLIATLVVCMSGLFLLDPDTDPLSTKLLRALWNAINLVSTLGDFTPFSDAQRVFLIGTMLLVVIVGGYAISSLNGLFSGNAYAIHRENKIVKAELSKLDNHVVVVGFGRLGLAVCKTLRDDGRALVVLERDDERVARASEHGFLVIQRDGEIDETTLFGLARLKHARALIVSTEDEDHALAVTLTARSYNPDLQISAVASGAGRAALLRRAGASTVILADALVAHALVGKPVGDGGVPQARPA